VAITTNDIKTLKSQGVLLNRNTEKFSARVITENGVMSSSEMDILQKAAAKYGSGQLAMTGRMTIEVPGIPFEEVSNFQQFIAQAGLETGGTGPIVRPITSCKGSTCIFGLYDTQALAKKIHDEYYAKYHSVTLPHKFKIAVGGCPNNCVKPDLNDFGIIGQRFFELKDCKNCKVCQVVEKCPMHAVSRDENNELVWDEDICNNCGRCISNCTFDKISETKTMYKVVIGGRWGKKTRLATTVPGYFNEEELFALIEKTLLFFKDRGNRGERLAEVIDRIGEDEVFKTLLSDEILERKEDIINLY
jgi:dissimilatory sulfite reductase (desulfoviridin) alpha/beta subunit